MAISALAFTPLLASCDSEPSDPMEAARASFETGKARIALAQASKAIEANPQSAEARMLAAEIAMALGNADRAITELKQVSPDAPEAKEANLKLAAAHLSISNFRMTKQLLENAPLDSAYAYFVNASLLMAEGDNGAAFSLVAQGLKQFPKDHQLVTLDAQRLFMSAKPQEAADRLSPVLSVSPAVPEAHMLAGQMLLNNREPVRAQEHFEKVLGVRPAQQTAMLAMAAIARDRGNETEAVRWINETNKYGAPQPLGLLFAAQMAYDGGDMERANELLEKFPPELTRLPQYQRLAGFIAAARGQRQVSINALLRYTESTDGDVLARRLLAENLAAQNKFGEAWTAISPVVDHPQADGATLILGLRLAEKTGQGNPAAIRTALARRDNAPSIAKPMIEAGKAIRAGDWAKADAIYTPLTKVKGAGDPALLNNAAAVKSKLGEHEAAIALARQALKLAPSSPEIMDTLGWAIWQSGTAPSEARSLLAKARSAAPNNREIAGRYAIVHAQS